MNKIGLAKVDWIRPLRATQNDSLTVLEAPSKARSRQRARVWGCKKILLLDESDGLPLPDAIQGEGKRECDAALLLR
jgi:hypothetical protein